MEAADTMRQIKTAEEMLRAEMRDGFEQLGQAISALRRAIVYLATSLAAALVALAVTQL